MPYDPPMLPLKSGIINRLSFLEELVDASSKLEVYKEKIRDSKLSPDWFMPTLQKKEALASSVMEGTQATIDGVLINQAVPDENNRNLNEVFNYDDATEFGYKTLRKDGFSDGFFQTVHSILMKGNVRKQGIVGEYRKSQNYIGRNDTSHAITYVPPVPGRVPELMHNLIEYLKSPTDSLRPLERAAIIHAQFETIHPFSDGNGRVGRMLIPMYLFSVDQIELPCFFISEALEHNKLKYYSLLNDTREKQDWNGWIRFFLRTVATQCDKYIGTISAINALYEDDVAIACRSMKSSNAVTVINTLYSHPITNAKQVQQETGLPPASVNRVLNALVEEKILYTDGKLRNRTFYYYDLLDIIRG